jgi:hypothetical protein
MGLHLGSSLRVFNGSLLRVFTGSLLRVFSGSSQGLSELGLLKILRVFVRVVVVFRVFVRVIMKY